jgi:hypothetical protein
MICGFVKCKEAGGSAQSDVLHVTPLFAVGYGILGIGKVLA